MIVPLLAALILSQAPDRPDTRTTGDTIATPLRELIVTTVWVGDGLAPDLKTARWEISGSSEAYHRRDGETPLTVSWKTREPSVDAIWFGEDGRMGEVRDIQIAPGGVRRVEIPITDGRTVTVRVVDDSTGEPIADARMTSLLFGFADGDPTDAQAYGYSQVSQPVGGVLKLPHVPEGAFVGVTVVANGYRTLSHHRSKESRMTVRLTPIPASERQAFHVVDSSGRPVAGVQVWRSEPGGHLNTWQAPDIVGDGEGRLILTAARADRDGRTWLHYVEAPGFRGRLLTDEDLAGGVVTLDEPPLSVTVRAETLEGADIERNRFDGESLRSTATLGHRGEPQPGWNGRPVRPTTMLFGPFILKPDGEGRYSGHIRNAIPGTLSFHIGSRMFETQLIEGQQSVTFDQLGDEIASGPRRVYASPAESPDAPLELTFDFGVGRMPDDTDRANGDAGESDEDPASVLVRLTTDAAVWPVTVGRVKLAADEQAGVYRGAMPRPTPPDARLSFGTPASWRTVESSFELPTDGDAVRVAAYRVFTVRGQVGNLTEMAGSRSVSLLWLDPPGVTDAGFNQIEPRQSRLTIDGEGRFKFACQDGRGLLAVMTEGNANRDFLVAPVPEWCFDAARAGETPVWDVSWDAPAETTVRFIDQAGNGLDVGQLELHVGLTGRPGTRKLARIVKPRDAGPFRFRLQTDDRPVGVRVILPVVGQVDRVIEPGRENRIAISVPQA